MGFCIPESCCFILIMVFTKEHLVLRVRGTDPPRPDSKDSFQVTLQSVLTSVASDLTPTSSVEVPPSKHINRLTTTDNRFRNKEAHPERYTEPEGVYYHRTKVSTRRTVGLSLSLSLLVVLVVRRRYEVTSPLVSGTGLNSPPLIWGVG